MQKPKRPAPMAIGNGAATSASKERLQNIATIDASQAAEIFVPHSDFAAVRVTTSRDRNRVNVEILLNQRGQWLAGGPVPSFPTNMLDSVINGLIQMRDRQVGGR